MKVSLNKLASQIHPNRTPDESPPVPGGEPTMSVSGCPHLGVAEDPGVCFGFANSANLCYKASPPQAVRLAYQQRVCLSGDCAGCLVYQPSWKGHLPAEISAARALSRHGPAYWIALVLAVGLVLLGLWYATTRVLAGGFPLIAEAQVLPQNTTPVPENLPATGVSPDAAGVPAVPQGLTPTPFSPTQTLSAREPGQLISEPINPSPTAPPSSTAALQATASEAVPAPAECTPPQDWVIYTVRAGDSLAKISRLSGISVQQIASANCLENARLIYAGQTLYLPHTMPVSVGVSSPPSSSGSPPDRTDTIPITQPER